MRILDDMDHIQATKCLTPEALEKATLAVQEELNILRLEDGMTVLFFNRVMEFCAREIEASLSREVTIDEKIFIGHQVYNFLVTRSGG